MEVVKLILGAPRQSICLHVYLMLHCTLALMYKQMLCKLQRELGPTQRPPPGSSGAPAGPAVDPVSGGARGVPKAAVPDGDAAETE